MNQWLDHLSSYPLINPGQLNGLFSDASFVMFNNFAPVINSLSLSNENLVLSFTFDDGPSSFSVATNLIYEGYGMVLSNPGIRNYGTVVFGRLIQEVLNGIFGNNITLNLNFEGCTVFSIDSTNGVYSVNGLTGNVALTTDSNLWYNSTNNTLNAASVPNNTASTSLSNTNLYLLLSSLQLLEFNVANNSASINGQLDNSYSAIYYNGTNLLAISNTGAGSSNLYNINTLPGTLVLNQIPYNITALTKDGSGNLWGLSGANLLNFGTSYTLTPTVVPLSITPISLVYFGSSFLACCAGPEDYSTSTQFSSQFYNITVSGSTATITSLGVMFDTLGHNHLSQIIALGTNSSGVYGVIKPSSLEIVLYQINPSTVVGTPLINYGGVYAANTPLSLFTYNGTIAAKPVTALKTINGVGVDSLNNINIIGSATLSITPTANDTLILNLPVSDANLNVTRTIQYD